MPHRGAAGRAPLHSIRPSGAHRGLGRPGYLATTYWVDVTDLAQVRDEYYAGRPMVAILTLDNYEELMKGVTDNEKSAMLSAVDQRLNQWITPAQGLFCKFDRDRYLFVFEERFLPQFQEGKFSVLDAVHQVVNTRAFPPPCPLASARRRTASRSCSSTPPSRWRWLCPGAGIRR